MTDSSNDPTSSSTPYTAAEKEGSGMDAAVPPSSTAGRQGHLFFGSYCDMRVATTAMNGLNVFFKCLVLMFGLARVGVLSSVSGHYVSILLSCVGIFGAYNYEYPVTGFVGFGFFVTMIVHCVRVADPDPTEGAEWIGIVFDMLLIYPHAVLTYEIRSGIMTKDTYTREEYLDPRVREQMERYSV